MRYTAHLAGSSQALSEGSVSLLIRSIGSCRNISRKRGRRSGCDAGCKANVAFECRYESRPLRIAARLAPRLHIVANVHLNLLEMNWPTWLNTPYAFTKKVCKCAVTLRWVRVALLITRARRKRGPSLAGGEHR